jgi:hypothetical protein
MVSVAVQCYIFPFHFEIDNLYIGCIFTIKPSLEGNKIVVLVPFKLFFKILLFSFIVLAKAILVSNRSTMALHLKDLLVSLNNS